MFESLSLWYTGLTPLLRLLWACAIVASVIFIIQNVLMLIGLGEMDSDADFDVSTDASGDIDVDAAHADGHDGTLGSAGIFSLFTLRNFINFFLGFGWGGISLSNTIESRGWLIVASVICGLFFVLVFMVMLRLILRLETNGVFRIQDCVGQTASVYLRIPANHAGAGKVQVSAGGSVHELAAYTDGDALPSGTRVKVVAVIDGDTLLVEGI
ncbi:MAG: NfeD family protein [Bacteroidaceae bacterium]|nr:NfeD family protein [Bacteroidaceae bacterium]